MLSGLVNGLASNAAGVVVASDADSAEDGELAALRDSELVGAIATVDGLKTSIGQVTTILALMQVLLGTGGSYGVGVRRRRPSPRPRPPDHELLRDAPGATGGVAVAG